VRPGWDQPLRCTVTLLRSLLGLVLLNLRVACLPAKVESWSFMNLPLNLPANTDPQRRAAASPLMLVVRLPLR